MISSRSSHRPCFRALTSAPSAKAKRGGGAGAPGGRGLEEASTAATSRERALQPEASSAERTRGSRRCFFLRRLEEAAAALSALSALSALLALALSAAAASSAASGEEGLGLTASSTCLLLFLLLLTIF